MSEIEIIIAKLLMEIAEGERSIEITRRVLSDCIEFDSYQIFKHLDLERKNNISPKNIIDFLFKKKTNISPEEAQLIILFYDIGQDGLLSYDELIGLIESKNKKSKKTNKFVLYENEISYNIEFSLEKLFIKELKLAKDILHTLKNIKNKSNYDIHSIYHSIKGINDINIENLRNFLDKNNISFLESDLNFIFNRLDINKDGKIDFVEFHSLFGFPDCYYCCPCIKCPFCGTRCCNECLFGTNGCIHHNLNSPCNCPKNGNTINSNNSYLSYNQTNSPNRNTEEKISKSLSLRLSPERRYAPIQIDLCEKCNNIPCVCNNFNKADIKSINSGIISNKSIYENISNNFNNNSSLRSNEGKISNNLSLRLSPERKYAPYEIEVELCKICNNFPCRCKNESLNQKNMKNNINNINNNTNLNINDINQFNEYFNILIKGEKVIELYKVQLALKNDFNCEDIFRLFEYDGRGFISFEDLKYGLDLLDSRVNEYIISLLMNRFDLRKKGHINYADFFDMIVPFQRSYRNLVEARIPLSNDPKNILNILDKNTISCLKTLFDYIIEYELRINDLRKKMNHLKKNIPEFFKLIDINNLGYFEYSDLINYLENSKFNFKQLNSDLLFIRLDKKRNGRVFYEDFEDEFCPL